MRLLAVGYDQQSSLDSRFDVGHLWRFLGTGGLGHRGDFNRSTSPNATPVATFPLFPDGFHGQVEHICNRVSATAEEHKCCNKRLQETGRSVTPTSPSGPKRFHR